MDEDRYHYANGEGWKRDMGRSALMWMLMGIPLYLAIMVPVVGCVAVYENRAVGPIIVLMVSMILGIGWRFNRSGKQ